MIVFQERGITHLDLHGERHADVSDMILDTDKQNQESYQLHQHAFRHEDLDE